MSRDTLSCRCLELLSQAAAESAGNTGVLAMICKACRASAASPGQPAGSTRTAALQAVETVWQHCDQEAQTQLLEVSPRTPVLLMV